MNSILLDLGPMVTTALKQLFAKVKTRYDFQAFLCCDKIEYFLLHLPIWVMEQYAKSEFDGHLMILLGCFFLSSLHPCNGQIPNSMLMACMLHDR